MTRIPNPPSAGDKLSVSFFRQLWQYLRETRIVPGKGIAVSRGIGGTVINCTARETQKIKSETPITPYTPIPQPWDIYSITATSQTAATVVFANRYIDASGVNQTSVSISTSALVVFLYRAVSGTWTLGTAETMAAFDTLITTYPDTQYVPLYLFAVTAGATPNDMATVSIACDLRNMQFSRMRYASAADSAVSFTTTRNLGAAHITAVSVHWK